MIPTLAHEAATLAALALFIGMIAVGAGVFTGVL